jgi:hypothetical protein
MPSGVMGGFDLNQIAKRIRDAVRPPS